MSSQNAQHQSQPRALAAVADACLQRGRRLLARTGSQSGFMLIEVLIASVLVSVMVIGTFSAFDILNQTDTSERQHNVASTLAEEGQEALRTDPATALDGLVSATELKNPHVYKQTVQGTTYTITQTAEPDNGANTSPVCTVEGATDEESDFLRVETSVSWPALGKRPPVTETSTITPPLGSALEVDVTNGGKPEVPVSGVTVVVDGVHTTTNEHGCVIYNGIQATSTEVEAYKTGYVTQTGAHTYIDKGIPLAPNVITHQALILAEAGAIAVKFQYKGSGTYSFTNAKKEVVSEPVESDTFVAQDSALPTPELVIGSTAFTYEASTADFEAQTGTYATAAVTAKEPTSYPKGALFPYSGNKWLVYAGDCSANAPSHWSITGAGETEVTAGNTSETTVPLSYVTLNDYKGSSSKSPEGLYTSATYPVKITNMSCTSPLAANPVGSFGAIYTHTQSTNGEAHLEHAFQPFGNQKLCIYNSSAKKTYTATYTNSTVAGSTVNIYLAAGEGTYTEGSGATLVSVKVLNNQFSNTC